MGGFTYSQGLEFAVEVGWVGSEADFVRWQEQILEDTLVHVDWPILARMYEGDLERWSAFLLAHRETAELRAEERQRGAALARVCQGLGEPLPVDSCQLAGFAWLGRRWEIPLHSLALGYGYSWLEGSVMAGLKLVPFGQAKAQSLLRSLSGLLPQAWARACALGDEELGGSFPLQAIASACHETQYSRLFRS